jgi:hypothetical protein
MAVQASSTVTNKPFIREGGGYVKNGTVAQIAVRTGAMALYTVMSYNPTTGQWHPLTNIAATDGTQRPAGILMKALTELELEAGDIASVPILIGNALVDKDQVILENSVTLATIITVPTNGAISVEDELRRIGIFVTDTVDTTEPA